MKRGALLLLCACHVEPPSKPPPTESRADLSSIQTTCARVASCADPHDPNFLRSPSACVDWWLVSTGAEPEMIACLSAARSCKDVERCTHDPADKGAVDFCVAHPGALGVCEGTRLYSCSDQPGESSAIDCAELGGTCVEQRVSGGLVVRGCASSTLCPGGAPTARCEQNNVVRCEDGMAERHTCPRGTRCAAGPEGATCEGEPLPDRAMRCAKPGFASCEGDRVTFCALVGGGAWLRTTDCAAWGMTCAMQERRANCVARAPACPAGEVRCDGGDLVFCAAGAPARVSCERLGFARCDPAARGQEPGCR